MQSTTPTRKGKRKTTIKMNPINFQRKADGVMISLAKLSIGQS